MRRADAGALREGFTLLEVLVALVIASFSLSLLYGSVSSGVAGVRIAGHYAEGLSRARSHIAGMGTDVGGLIGRHDGDDGNGFHWQLSVEPVPGDRDPDGYALYDCVLLETWQDGVVPRQIMLETKRLGHFKVRALANAPPH